MIFLFDVQLRNKYDDDDDDIPLELTTYAPAEFANILDDIPYTTDRLKYQQT